MTTFAMHHLKPRNKIVTVSEKRRMIINADDFGLSAGVNQGVRKAYEQGVVTSASLMVFAPAAAEAAMLAKYLPALSVGLHIDVGEWYHNGRSWCAVYERAPQHDAAALWASVSEQLRVFRELLGINPTHVDSHQHAHLHEPLQSIARSFAVQLNVPLRHFCHRVKYCGDFHGQGQEGQKLKGRLNTQFLRKLIKTLRHPLTELCCHPAATVDFESTYSEERVKELEVLCSPSLIQTLREVPIKLINFQGI